MKNVNTNKVDVEAVMEKLIVQEIPADGSDFWFSAEEITDEDGNPTVFHVMEGDGSNLSDEDEEEGFSDYICYDTYDGEITSQMIEDYLSGDDPDTLEDMASDGGMALLYNSYSDLTVKQICWKVLNVYGVESPEDLTVKILA